ncbi:MAG TPA: MFS transporter [Pseudonocardia sp.]|jgi:predicted MFS family arabinose efflux permease|nr:MFS transporter [Pseudonocardia sp.]
MRSPAFRLVLAATVLGFGGYALLLPVVPLWVARGGSGEFGAGVTTGVLMAATVATQLAVPALLRRFGHRPVLAAGLLLLGAPTPLLLLSPDLPPVLALSAVRGVGFGLLTVAGSAVVAELVPPAEHGRASARYGYAVGIPQLALLPAGVAVVDLLGFDGVFLAAGIAPLAGLVCVAFLRTGAARPAEPHRTAAEAEPDGTFRRRAVAPVLAMLACSTAQGGIVTFLPLVAPGSLVAVPLALFGTALGGLLGRGLAGEIVDRRGEAGRLLPVGAAIAAAGMVGEVVAAGGDSPVLLVVGAALVGIGFGLVQNDALVALFAAGGAGRYGTASAVWNIAYDAGTGVGATGLGAVAEPLGFRAAFALAAAVLFLAVPFTSRVVRGKRR